MTRVGWVVLGAILLVVGVFVSLLSFGGGTPAPRVTQSVSAPARLGDPLSLEVPVAGVARRQVSDTWGDPRPGARGHHGTDIIAPAGASVIAAAPGTIEKLFQSRLGGTTLYQRSLDRRWTFYYAHLAGYAPGIVEGKRVRAGELIGYVGDTGDAGPGNYHLHFSAARLAPDQHWYQGQDVNAYPLLAGRSAAR